MDQNNNSDRYFIIFEQAGQCFIEEWFDRTNVNKRTLEISILEGTKRSKLIKVIYGKPVDLFCVPTQIKTIDRPI